MKVAQKVISLRTKMLLLLMTSLVICTVLVTYVNVSVFMDDKTSSYLEYSQARAKLISDSIEKQLQSTFELAHEIQSRISISDFELKNGNEMEKLFYQSVRSLNLQGLMLLKAENGKPLHFLASWVRPEELPKELHGESHHEDHDEIHSGEIHGGEGDDSLDPFEGPMDLNLIQQLGWDYSHFKNSHFLVSRFSPKHTSSVNPTMIVAGTLIHTSDGEVAVLFLLTPRFGNEARSQDFHISLVDTQGEKIQSQGVDYSWLQRPQILKMIKPVLDESKSSGVRKWTQSHENFVISYQQSKYRDLVVLTLVSEKSVFQAVKWLFLRSYLVGLGILFIAIGIALVIFSKMNHTLKSVLGVIEKIHEGDYEYRVDTDGISQDELGILATSFNTVASKMDTLVTDAVSQVVQKHQDQIYEVIRDRVLQNQALDLPQLGFCARTSYCKKYRGDWWHYEVIKDSLFILVGKLEAEEVQAIVTLGHIRGAFSTYKEVVQTDLVSTPQLKYLAHFLNSAVHDLGQGREKLRCSLISVHMKTGEAEILNFDHCTPIHFSRKSKKTLLSKKLSPLGTSQTLQTEKEVFQLSSGDSIFCYTPGLLKMLKLQTRFNGIDDLSALIPKFYENHHGHAESISEEMNTALSGLMHGFKFGLVDDMTTAVLTISPEARFSSTDMEEIAS